MRFHLLTFVNVKGSFENNLLAWPGLARIATGPDAHVVGKLR